MDSARTLRLRQVDSIRSIDATRWDALFPSDYPFTRHALLDALERNGCATPRTGWTAAHALLEDPSGRLLAAAPLYLKSHSYGEFVFDFAWADASRRLRQPYYPKLLCAVPFTPSAGPRIGAVDSFARKALAAALVELPQSESLSSFHALFVDADDSAAFGEAGCVEREDVQFHWFDRGYSDFTAFLATLNSEKRKKILRERRRVAEAGLRFETRAGETLSEAEWAEVYALYSNTYEERGQAPYLSFEFFLDYGRAAGTPITLVLVYEDQRMVAVAITLRGGDTLYGRHWGAADRYHSLHFETCYYQGIELCLREGLKRFDAGAQGEHKRARGFEPVRTRSQHRLADPRLHRAVAHALTEERAWVAQRDELMNAHSPFRRDDAAEERPAES